MAIPKFDFGDGGSGKWSTIKLDALMKYIDDTGVLPKDNPFFDRNVKWRKANIDYDYTKEEFLELVKIKENILHFAESYAKVQTDNGQTLIRLRPYQKKVLLQFKRFRNNVYLASRQVGKSVTSETLVYMELPGKGYITMPIFEAYYLMKNKLTPMDKIIRFLYRINYRLFIYGERLVGGATS